MVVLGWICTVICIYILLFHFIIPAFGFMICYMWGDKGTPEWKALVEENPAPSGGNAVMIIFSVAYLVLRFAILA